jgi:hypothetical protein
MLPGHEHEPRPVTPIADDGGWQCKKRAIAQLPDHQVATLAADGLRREIAQLVDWQPFSRVKIPGQLIVDHV